jgi:hypothetical protein
MTCCCGTLYWVLGICGRYCGDVKCRCSTGILSVGICGRYCGDETCWCGTGVLNNGNLWTVLCRCDMFVGYRCTDWWGFVDFTEVM